MPAPFDTSAIDALARECAAASDEVRRTGDTADQRARALRWHGGRGADQHRFTVGQTRGDLHHDADDLDQIRLALQRHSEWIRARESHLRDLERRILNWFHAHPPRIDLPGNLDARLLSYIPASLSDEWETVANRLRALGVHF